MKIRKVLTNGMGGLAFQPEGGNEQNRKVNVMDTSLARLGQWVLSEVLSGRSLQRSLVAAHREPFNTKKMTVDNPWQVTVGRDWLFQMEISGTLIL